MMEIHPAPLCSKYSDFLNIISELEPLHPHFDVDIVDWQRTKLKTISVLEALSVKSNSKMNFDLMMDFPTQAVKLLLNVARVDTIILNLDCKEDIHSLIDLIHFHNKKVGISINPEHHFYQIVPFFPQVDFIQIFTVEPGSQGNPFLKERLELVKNIRDFCGECPIGVDGGINFETLKTVKDFGVNIASVGSAIQKSKDPRTAYLQIVELAK